MTDDRLLPLLRQRWSPRGFDAAHELQADDVDVLLEAARWAPSAGNSQPWAFHAVVRGAAGWDEIVGCLAASSAPWASEASLLVVNMCQRFVAETDWEYSEFSDYDLGQAVAHMTIQAESMGLACRQFRAFDKEAVTALLDVPAHWNVVTMTAVGRPGPVQRGPRASRRVANLRWPRE